LSRRSYLKMSGTALAVTAALAGHDAATAVPERAALSLHGYGGMPVVEQHGSETTNALAGATRADLVAVSETEPNDTKATAQHVGVGSTVDATLAEAEVEYADKKSPAIDVRFRVVDEAALLEYSEKLSNRYPLSICPVLSYILAKEREVENIRAVARGREAGLPVEEIEEELIQ